MNLRVNFILSLIHKMILWITFLSLLSTALGLEFCEITETEYYFAFNLGPKLIVVTQSKNATERLYWEFSTSNGSLIESNGI